MIRLKRLTWSYAFSYGKNNTIDFSENQLTQLLGKNGHGKSSIALILEEVLFNTNSKKIKKADVINRYADAKAYTISLDFSKDSDDYGIVTNRGSTQTVKLYKNKEDISSHTSTGTYKLIEEIIGMDHKTFTQIVYQSSAHSLEFLTATDTNRKKFLIELLNQTIYTQYAEVFKGLVKDITSGVDTSSTKLKTISDWLTKFGSIDLTKKDLKGVPDPLVDEPTKIIELKDKLANIEANNKKIIQNNKYIEILNSIELTNVPKPISNLMDLKVEIRNKESEYSRLAAGAKGTVSDTCSSCGQTIDNSSKKKHIEECKTQANRLVPVVKELKDLLASEEKNWAVYEKSIQAQQDWEKYHALINETLPKVLYDRAEIEKSLSDLENTVRLHRENTTAIIKYNSEATSHNTKIDVVIQQMDTMKADFDVYSKDLATLSKRLGNLQILVKTFGTSGLVAYKIECLVKDLEELTNEYLAEISDGRFLITFAMNSSDKLNVIITDNGNDIDILALSSGERARVNTATLLGIRRLLQSLSSSRINLLILDETISNLDTEGKEKLIEILLKEDSLNTVLISHDFSHPLLEKITVVKENNISRIE